MIQIVPAILATTEEQYAQDVQKIASCELLHDGWVQIDIEDNKFVQNQTINLDSVSKFPLDLKKEAHLMVVDPRSYLAELKQLGFLRVIVHQEIENLTEVIKAIKEQGLEVGVALNPETAVSSIEPLLATIEVVQIMSIQPGFQGQEFLEDSIQKIADVAQLRSKAEATFLIAVDGGVKVENVKQVIEAGADNLVIGSALLKGDIDETMEQIWEALR